MRVVFFENFWLHLELMVGYYFGTRHKKRELNLINSLLELG